MAAALNTCRRCGAQFLKRPGRGRQPSFCEDCRPRAAIEARQRRFLQRYHIVDTFHRVCISCGEGVGHGESA